MLAKVPGKTRTRKSKPASCYSNDEQCSNIIKKANFLEDHKERLFS